MRWRALSTTETSLVELVPQITLENVPTAALIIDGAGRVLHSNQRASLLLERSVAQLRGMSTIDLIGRDLLWTSSDGSAQTMSVTLQRPSGRKLSVAVSISTLVESDGQACTMVLLTPTRNTGDERPEPAPRIALWSDVAERIGALEGDALCVALGIIGLQAVNEGFSRSTGDFVLTEIDRRLSTLTSPSVIERISGNRFVVATPATEESRRAVALMISAVREPVETPLGFAAVGCAAGVTVGPSRPALVLIDRADRNLESAMARGAGAIEWRDGAQRPAISASARLGAPLLASIAGNEIFAHFQPVVELSTGRVVEYEALARWSDGESGIRGASQFIDVARNTGAITELGANVLRSVMELCRCVEAQGTGARVSLNVSAHELGSPVFVSRLLSAVEEYRVDPRSLQVELTDAIAAEHAESIRANIRSIREFGARFALDGFGTHAADLLSLRESHIDAVKLDGAITRGVADDPRAMRVLHAVLGLATELGIDVIAKGIELMDQHELLLKMGCRFGQGYLYAAPTPAAELDLTQPAPTGDRYVPPKEAMRLGLVRGLHETEALDAAGLNDLIRAAAQQCGYDMGSVSVIEDGIRWVAWEISSRVDPKPPGIDAFARRVRQHGPMQLERPTEFPVASLAGTPVITSDGLSIGALCVASMTSKPLNDAGMEGLARFAEHIAARVERTYLTRRGLRGREPAVVG